jgi:hypothetical protein
MRALELQVLVDHTIKIMTQSIPGHMRATDLQVVLGTKGPDPWRFNVAES